MKSLYISKLFILVVVFAGYAKAQDAEGFLFTIPRVLRYGTVSKFCLTMVGEEETFKPATVSLLDSNTGATEMLVEHSYPVGQQSCKKFQVPKPGQYELLIYNETDVLHDPVKVTVLSKKLITFVQTDKPQYKPGQIVKFRILTLLSSLLPRTEKIKKVFIIDPNDIRVKQYLDVECKGISSLDFQLVSEAKLGSWKIDVILDEEDERNQESTTVTFDVKEYVLPRFEVLIEPPSYILADADTIEGKICAKYTYGKDVKGFLDFKVCWQQAFGPPSGECVHEVVEISGCYNFSVNATEVKGIRPSYFGSELRIKASVTEHGTGVVVNKTHHGPGESFEPLKMEIDDYTHGFFKPGLPYYGKVTVKKPDGQPAGGEVVKITAIDYDNNLRYSKSFTSGQDGVITYALCGHFTENTTAVSIEAEAVMHKRNANPTNSKLYSPRAHKNVRQWFSPSLSYIQIPRPDLAHKTKCDERLTLNIPFTTRKNTDVTFHFQVMSRGEMIKSGRVSHSSSAPYLGMLLVRPPPGVCLEWEAFPTEAPPPPPESTPPTPETQTEESNDGDFSSSPDLSFPEINIDEVPLETFQEPIVRSELVSDTVSTFLLDLPISASMPPRFTLLVYHVLQDGEVVADSMEFEVEPCFANEVTMEFNQTTVLPGDKIDIKLGASPGSVCGVGIVDKSVNILGGEHQITSEKVFKEIEEFVSSRFADQSIPYHNEDDYCEERINRIEVDRPSEVNDAYWHYTSKYVDAIQAFKSSGFMVITNLNLETRPCGRDYPVFYDIPVALAESGNSLAVPGMPGVPIARGSSMPKQNTRSHFPETWLWQLTLIGDDGSAVIKETAPHTITSWVGNALCIDQKKGFGLSPLTSLTTFQPFFLSLHLPYAAVRGERLKVLFTVYNYLKKCLVVKLSLNMDADVSTHSGFENICVCGDDSYTVNYIVEPRTIGHVPVEAKAEIVPGTCKGAVDVDLDYLGLTDIVQRKLFVKAEGVSQELTHTSYICSKDGSVHNEDIVLSVPEDIVQDSARGEIQIIGDIMGPALKNLGNLVRMPTGCGEQNMVGFVPNILVLEYLSNTGRLTEEIQVDAIKHMEKGYQKELKYRHFDGSYSAFGERDPRGSVWLTAFVVKSYAQARPYIYIDQTDFDISIEYLRRSQLENGCFRETGKVFSSYMMGGLNQGKAQPERLTALTAYVVVSLLTANVNASSHVITEAMKCIHRDYYEYRRRMDPYSLALAAYASALYEPTDRVTSNIIRTLESVSKKDGDLQFWSRGRVQRKPSDAWSHQPAPPAEVEMTAYALLAYITVYGESATSRAHGIAMWLSQQRNPLGGFSSTQDTVVGLNALSEFASLAYSVGESNMKVHVSGDNVNHIVGIRSANANYAGDTTLMHTFPVTKLPNTLNVTTKGVGCALVQTSVHFNKFPKDLIENKKPSFDLKVGARLYQHDIDKCDKRTISIAVGLRGNPKQSNGMSLITVGMVTAWRPEAKSLLKLESMYPQLGMKRHEYNEEEGVLTLYFDEITKETVEFTIDVEQDKELAVSAPKEAQVKVFQYYETDAMRVQSYGLRTICGTKLSIPRNKLPTNGGWPVQVRVDGPSRPSLDNSQAGPGRVGRVETRSSCPVCLTSKKVPSNLLEKVCTSSAAYKAFAGRKGKNPLKLRHDLRPKRKLRNLNIFARHNMPADCDCSLLRPPSKRIVILVRDRVKGDLLNVDDDTLVLVSNKKMDKAIRQAQKRCPINSSK